MYSKILIISDNVVLSKKINEIINDLNFSNLEWDFAISVFSDISQFKKVLIRNPKVYDLKNEIDVDDILMEYDLVFSLHCKQLFPPKMVSRIKCINIHPGYNPINRGWYPQVFAIIQDLPIGATIHEIDNKLDNGPIIARRLVEKSTIDTSETLYKKIIELEVKLFRENIISIIKNTYSTFLPETEGELKLKSDFENLCQLDLDEKLTTRQFIDKLRALTHGEYNNAFFIDPKTEDVIYVSINLKKL